MTKSNRREAMTLPGFNAERSLYKTSLHYRLMGGSAQADGIMLQQFGFPGGCFGRCARACRGSPYYQACYLECVLDNCE